MHLTVAAQEESDSLREQLEKLRQAYKRVVQEVDSSQDEIIHIKAKNRSLTQENGVKEARIAELTRQNEEIWRQKQQCQCS
jgi:FtsZ-binding cell division protein ZapB